MMAEEQDPRIDRIARTLAGSAGLVWDLLERYPGYGRGYWRDRARATLRALESPPGRHI